MADVILAEPAYEMLWDCKFCGAKKLLGLTHRHCPSCGAPQNAEERYFPSDADKIAVQNHIFYGADVTCTHCGDANSKNSKHCGGCGAPLEGAKEVARRADQVVGPGDAFAGQTAMDAHRERTGHATPAAAAAKRVPLRWIFAVGCLGVLALFTFVLVLIFWKKQSALEVVGHHWQRQIVVEQFGPVEQSSWCDDIPGDARLVRRHREVRSRRQVADGQDCKVRKIDNGNGTFSEKQDCTTRYREEPVYDQKCVYVVTRWKTARTATADGASLSMPLRWPDPELARAGTCEGCEREGTRKETYTVLFRDSKGGEQSCDFDAQKWASIPDGSRWKGALRVVGSALDCGSLRPR